MEALLYFAFWAAMLFLMMRVGCGAHVMGHGRDAPKEDADPGASGGLRWIPPKQDVDPVCGKTVQPEQAKPSVHAGYVYYFCSRECREAFEAAPETYVGSAADANQQLVEQSHV